jgi:hypothetical protein
MWWPLRDRKQGGAFDGLFAALREVPGMEREEEALWSLPGSLN